MAKKTEANELRALAKNLLSVADSLDGQAETEKEKEKEISYTDVRAILAEKSRAGHTAKIKEILISHGAEKLSAIDPGEYAALLREVEVL